MTTDDIARILAALHDITPEKVRAVIEGAEKLRGLMAPPAPPPTVPHHHVKKEEPVPTTPPAVATKDQAHPAKRGAIVNAVTKCLQASGRSRIADIAAATSLTYAQVNGALQSMRNSGAAVREGDGWHALTFNAPSRLGRPPSGDTMTAARRKGGLAGGKARAASLTPEERSAIAKQGGDARWSKTPKLPSEHPPLPPPIDPRKRTIPTAPFITKHARERWAEHHDDTSNEAILTSYTHGIEIDAGIAAQVTNVARRGAGDSTYRLSPDRRGIFVVADNLGSKTLVTYLRLTEKHVEWFLENYPVSGQNTTAH